jgi:hypothetical protein
MIMTRETRLRALENQVRRLQQRLARLRGRSQRYSWLRLAVFVGGLLLSGLGLVLAGGWAFGLCLLATGALFGASVYGHQRIETSIRRHQALLQIQSAQVARARLDWERIPAPFPHRRRPEHPFEADLDLVGQRSLQRLIDTAVSYEGSQRLRDWLAQPVPDRQQTLHRQRLVRELAPLSLFRNRLGVDATVAMGRRRTWEADQLTAWLERRAPEGSLRRWLLLFAGLAALNVLLLVADFGAGLPALWQFSFVLYLGLLLFRTRATEALFDEALALHGVLQQLGAVFGRLETFSYRQTPHLRALCQPFLDATHRPSRYLARTSRLVAAMGIRGNPVVRVALNAVLPWDAYFVYRLDRTKADMAGRAPAWMAIWFELEALSSLANLAYLNPEYAFPALVDGGTVFQAEGLGHPLISDGRRVCNDLTVPELGRIAVITGSNMAGKSVFLKTVGLNLALAYAGGPVCARHLETALFRLYTSMGISDSVTDGISYFYAEVKRLKRLLDELQAKDHLPLWFCIDEIFRGTNNRERLLGSRAYVRQLAGRHGVGLIATHDLELAQLAEDLPQVENYHFRDSVVGGRMVFDYKLRPGPCPTTNALQIMALEGLPVPEGI